jgi:hypothetical protein
MLDTCYLCERESIDEDEENVLKRLLEATAKTIRKNEKVELPSRPFA